MAGSVSLLRCILLAAGFGPAALGAEPSPSAHPANRVAPMPVASAAPAAISVAEPFVSPQLAKLFAGNPPKFSPPKPDSAASAPAGPGAEQPRNGIVHLPTYIVRGNTRLPDEYQLLTPQGRDAAMAQRYMGPQNTLDHVLNAVTLADLWKSIPLLGKIPFVPFDSKSYNERAASIYERPELKRRFDELMNIELTARKLESSAPAEKK
jgi:hypothetical protein